MIKTYHFYGRMPKSQNPGRGNRIITSMKRRLKLGDRVLNLQLRPRATWAQLLSLSGLDIEWALMDNTYVDVDSIPGSLDVPPQMVNVDDLGKLAILMGFDSIKMNAQERDFQAVGKAGSITTEDLTGFGKVLRFQKHNDKQFLPVLPSRKWYLAAGDLTEGRFDNDVYHIKTKGSWLARSITRFLRRSIEMRPAIGMRIEADAMVLAWERAVSASPEMKITQ